MCDVEYVMLSGFLDVVVLEMLWILRSGSFGDVVILRHGNIGDVETTKGI